jgi:predicted ATPase
MGNQALRSLEIRNFRAFHHLQIPALGQVNLIIGSNNVGKTSLLEALWLYAYRGDRSVVWSILSSHQESPYDRVAEARKAQDKASLRFLFHGRKDFAKEPTDPIQIGPMDDKQATLVVLLHNSADLMFLNPTFGGKPRAFNKIEPERRDPNARWPQRAADDLPCLFIPATGLTQERLTRAWVEIAVSDELDDVVAALQIIEPAINRVGVEGEPVRIPRVNIPGNGKSLPLRSLGEGMNRIFGIAVALVNVRDGMLLVDEIESGLHFSAQYHLWRLIFEVAHRLNVQVFATTHSWDCIEAFQTAALKNERSEGLLIRLGWGRDTMTATLFDEREMTVVTREQIEVR